MKRGAIYNLAPSPALSHRHLFEPLPHPASRRLDTCYNEIRIMQTRSGLHNTLRLFLYIGYALLVIALAYAVSAAGYHYMFDNDEISHAQVAYLIHRGYQPYRDFFSVYPLIFDRMLSSLFAFTGFSFDAIFSARILMILLFWVRIAGAAVLTYLLFGFVPAILFIPLSLLDPFTVFSGMQIRPDNLMLVFFILAAISFLLGIERRKRLLLSVSGVMLALSLLTLPKILPSAAAFVCIAVWYFMRHGKITLLAFWGSSFVLTVFAYILYFAFSGTLPAMLEQTIADARSTNNALLYPVKLGSFYYADNNIYLYGHPGKPLTWMYAWIIPITGFAGMFSVFSGYLKKKVRTHGDAVKMILLVSLVLQWVSLFFIHSVFLQYYIPITWLFALFTAVLVADMSSSLAAHRTAFLVSAACAGILLILAAHTQVTGNLKRTTYDNTVNRKAFSAMWSVLEPEETSFPNALFHPLAYPLPYGYFYADIPPGIIARYPPLDNVIEEQKIRVLFIDDYFMEKLPVKYKSYISANYRKIAEPIPHFVRNP
jgi:hypothetical protein